MNHYDVIVIGARPGEHCDRPPAQMLIRIAEQPLNWSGLNRGGDCVRAELSVESKTLHVSDRRASRQSAAAHGQDRSILTGPQSRTCIFMRRSIQRRLAARSPFRHSGRAVAGRAPRARLAGSPCEPPRDYGRSAPRRTYDRMSDDVRTLTGQEPLSPQEFVRNNGLIHRAGKSSALEPGRMNMHQSEECIRTSADFW